MKISIRRKRPNAWKQFVLGLAGGAAGTYAMSFYWPAVKKITGSDPRKKKVPNDQDRPMEDISVMGKNYREGEQSTVTVGRIAYREATGNEPQTEETKKVLSNTVHWSYGTIHGGMLALAATKTKAEIPTAAAYGTGLWLMSVFGLPVMGITKGPGAYPVSQHIHSLIAHCVYAFTSSGVRRLLSRIL